MAILLAVNLGLSNEELLREASMRAGGGPVVLVSVSAAPAPLDVLERLHRLAAPLRAAGIPVRLRALNGDRYERIRAEALRSQARLVIVGPDMDPGRLQLPCPVVSVGLPEQVVVR